MSKENIVYEFNITIEGTGEDVDQAFQNALDKINENPGEAIKGEVIYVNVSSDTDIEIEN